MAASPNKAKLKHNMDALTCHNYVTKLSDVKGKIARVAFRLIFMNIAGVGRKVKGGP